MSRERTYMEYLQDLRNRVFRITIAVGLATALCMTFSIRIFNFDGYKIPLPHPDPFNNMAIQVILALKDNLLPQNVNLIQITPLGAFSTQINVAAMLGIILVMPIIVRYLVSLLILGFFPYNK